MDIRVVGSENDYRLVFEGAMTHAFSRELEDQVIGLMRRHRCLKIDLSGVDEIDLFGTRLIGILQNLGGRSLQIVATSPAVEHALAQQRSSGRNGGPRRQARHLDSRQPAHI